MPAATTARAKVSLPASEVLPLHSAQTGQDYEIFVSLPFSYRRTPGKTYPTVYVLDGNLFFGLVAHIVRILDLGAPFPEVIVAGIGYPLDETGDAYRREFVRRRILDFTPVVDRRFEEDSCAFHGLNRVETGGAGRFLRFIAEELVPAVESEYRADPADRTLAGHSLGGMFTLYALFQEPRIFHRFVSGSPALGYAGSALFAVEEEYARSHTDLPAALFLAIGDLEEVLNMSNPLDATVLVSHFYRFSATLERRGYPSLQLKRQIFPGYAHLNIPAPLFQAGLESVFGES